jgi:hypothetical protein
VKLWMVVVKGTHALAQRGRRKEFRLELEKLLSEATP